MSQFEILFLKINFVTSYLHMSSFDTNPDGVESRLARRVWNAVGPVAVVRHCRLQRAGEKTNFFLTTCKTFSLQFSLHSLSLNNSPPQPPPVLAALLHPKPPCGHGGDINCSSLLTYSRTKKNPSRVSQWEQPDCDFEEKRREFRPYRLLYIAVIWIFTQRHVNGNNSGIFIFMGNGNGLIGILSFSEEGQKTQHLRAYKCRYCCWSNSLTWRAQYNPRVSSWVCLTLPFPGHKYIWVGRQDSFMYRHIEAWCFCLWQKATSVWLEDIPHRWAKRHLLCILWHVSVTQK